MPISVVFDPPLPSDSPSTFNTKAFTLLGDLNDWSTQANALPGEVATNLTTLLASPPAIGGTTPAAGGFTTLSASGTMSMTGGTFKNAYAPFKFFEGYAGSVTMFQTNVINGGLWFNRYIDAAGNAKVYNTGATGFISFNNSVGIRLGAEPSSAADSAVAQTTLMDIKTDGTIALYGQTTVNVPAVLGYGTGAGGTVTQATSKSTAVTLNKPSGQITMNNAALAAGDVALFQVTNSVAVTSSIVLVSPNANPAGEFYSVWSSHTFAGGFFVCVKNITAGSRSEALVINFAVLSGATS